MAPSIPADGAILRLGVLADHRREAKATVAQGRQVATNLAEALEVESGNNGGLLVGRLSQDRPPGVDDHAAAIAGPARRVRADLTGGKDEALVLDRPGAQQELPVVAPSLHRKSRRNTDDFSAVFGQLAVELRETEVVA